MSIVSRVFKGLAIILPVAIVGLLLWFNPNHYRQQICDQVTQYTNLRCQIGEIDYKLLSPFDLTIKQLQLGTPNKTVLETAALQVTLGSLDLFNRELSIDNISINHSHINLSQAIIDEIRANLPPSNLAENSTDTDNALLIAQFEISEISLHDLNLQWQDPVQPLSIKQLDIKLAPWQLINHHQLDPEKWVFNASLYAAQLNTTALPITDIGADIALEMQTAMLNLSNVSASLLKGSLKLDMQLDLNTLALEIQQAEMADIRIEADDAWFASTPTTTSAKGSQGSTPLPLSSVHIAQFALHHIQFFSAHPSLPLSITNLSMSMDDFTPVKHNQLNIHPYNANQPAGIKLSADNIHYQDYNLDNLNMALKYVDETMDLQQFSANLLDGQLTAKARIEQLKQPRITIEQLDLDNIRLTLQPEWLPQQARTTTQPAATPAPATNTQAEQNSSQPLPIAALTIKQSNIRHLYVDSASAALPLSIKDLNLHLSGAELINQRQFTAFPVVWNNAALSSSFAKLSYRGAVIKQLQLAAQFSTDKIHLKQLNATLPAGEIKAQGNILLNQSSLPARLDLIVNNLNLAELSKLTDAPSFPADGLVDIQARLFTRLAEPDDLLQHLNGSVHLTGEALTVKNIELDKILNRLLDSQELGVVDIAAYATLGPVGVLYSQASQLGATVFGLGSGETHIDQIEINVGLKNGEALISQSALATEQFHIAVKGNISLPQQRFEELQTGILNQQGCAELIRTIDGPFSNPNIELINTVLGTAFSPVTSLYRSTMSMLGSKCEPFYRGNIPYPAKGRRGMLNQITEQAGKLQP